MQDNMHAYSQDRAILDSVLKVMEQTKHEIFSGVEERLAEHAALETKGYQPTKYDIIAQYLHLLYSAQAAGHTVHDEIKEALITFRKEAGF
jgi:hypothetical protein